jgi:DNA invertase Pin-like site-specific DNA recombinase
VFLYARVATAAQAQDLDRQLARLRAAVAELGGTVAGEYVDECPGDASDRAGLNSLLDNVALGPPPRPDVVLVTSSDRLARELARREGLINELQRHGCKVEFADEPLSDGAQD